MEIVYFFRKENDHIHSMRIWVALPCGGGICSAWIRFLFLFDLSLHVQDLLFSFEHRNVTFSIIVCWLSPWVQNVFRCGIPVANIHVFFFSFLPFHISLEVLSKEMLTWSTWINTNHKGLCRFLSLLNDNFARKTFSGCLFSPLRSMSKCLKIKMYLYVLTFWLEHLWKFSSIFNVIQKKSKRNINEQCSLSTERWARNSIFFHEWIVFNIDSIRIFDAIKKNIHETAIFGCNPCNTLKWKRKKTRQTKYPNMTFQLFQGLYLRK